jgi:hypothetical protein
MPTKELQLHRRRWTLVFSLPFTLVIGAIGAYSIFLLFTAEERFVLAVAGCGAFVYAGARESNAADTVSRLGATEIAGRRTARTRFAFACQTDARAFIDARGNVDGQRLGLFDTTLAAA